MRFSESLQRNIMETNVGRLLNKFKIRSRRNVLFFGDILVNYIKECENAGYGEEMKNITQKWANLIIQSTVPKIFKKVPIFFLNKIIKKIWINLGLMDDFRVIKNKNIIQIKTKNEIPTKIIGRNNFIVGFYTGILNILFNSQIECIKMSQKKKYCKYTFRIENKSFVAPKFKSKKDYNKLNRLIDKRGFTLKDLIKRKIFQLNDNKFHFRGRFIVFGENTLSHLIGNLNILLEKIPYISHDYFKNIIKKDSTDEEKLFLIKILIQAMGWGILKIVKSKKSIIIEITNPPYGLQVEKDNWEFLTRTILGYLWLLNKNFRVKNINEYYKKLTMIYSN